MYFISTHKRITSSVMTQIKTITPLTKWYSRHIKGSSKKISKSKAMKDAKVKTVKSTLL